MGYGLIPLSIKVTMEIIPDQSTENFSLPSGFELTSHAWSPNRPTTVPARSLHAHFIMLISFRLIQVMKTFKQNVYMHLFICFSGVN